MMAISGLVSVALTEGDPMPIAQWLGLAIPGPGELSPKRVAEDAKDAFVADNCAHVQRGHADRADHESRDQGEVVKRLFESYRRGDYAQAAACLAPEVELGERIAALTALAVT
jgi:hypothetical protein